MTETLTAFDPAEFLDDDDAMEEYMLAAFETGDPKFITRSLGVVARARNMTELARKAGLSRSALYRSLSDDGNPEFATILKIMDVLGLKIGIQRRETGETAA